MPKYFVDIVYVIDAEDDEHAHEIAEQIALYDPDVEFETSWVNDIEETDEYEDE